MGCRSPKISGNSNFSKRAYDQFRQYRLFPISSYFFILYILPTISLSINSTYSTFQTMLIGYCLTISSIYFRVMLLQALILYGYGYFVNMIVGFGIILVTVANLKLSYLLALFLLRSL